MNKKKLKETCPHCKGEKWVIGDKVWTYHKFCPFFKGISDKVEKGIVEEWEPLSILFLFFFI